MMQPVGQMMCFVQPRQNIFFYFLFNLMQKKVNLNEIVPKLKHSQKKKKIPFPEPQKLNICAVLLWLSKIPFLTASAAAAT